MSVEGNEFTMMLLGWILFLLTLQIAIWRDVVRQNLANDDLEYWRSKQAQWQTEKKNMNDLIERLNEVNQQFASMLENVRKAANRFVK